MNIYDIIGAQYLEFDNEYPQFTGIARSEIGKPGTKAELFVAGKKYIIEVDPVTGKYDWAAIDAFKDGNYSASLRIIDSAGNASNPLLLTFVVDTTPPESPDLIKLYDDVGPVQRSFDPGEKTDDKRPTLTGLAQRGATVYLLNEKNERIGSAVADSKTGKWEMELSQDLKEGSNSLRLVAEEFFAQKYRIGEPSEVFVINVETLSPPSVPVIAEGYDDFGPVHTAFGNRGRTDDSTPTLKGTGTPGSIIYFQSTLTNVAWRDAGSVVVKSDGTWSWTSPKLTQAGVWDFRAKAHNDAGDSAWSQTFILTYTSTAPATPVIIDGWDNFGPDTGSIKNGGTTDDRTLTLRGTGAAGELIKIGYQRWDGDYNPIGQAIVKADGTWEWTTPELRQNGAWYFTATAVNGHGASGVTKFHFYVEPDTTPDVPAIPVIVDFYDDFGTSKGPVIPDGAKATTDDTTPTLRGVGTAGSIVYIQSAKEGDGWSALGSVRVDSNGKWEFTPATLDYATWQFRVMSSNAGGESAWSKKVYLNVVTLPQFGSEDFSAYLENVYLPQNSTFITTGGLVIESRGLSNSILSKKTYAHDEGGLFYGSQDASFANTLALKINFPKADFISFDVSDVQTSKNRLSFFDQNSQFLGAINPKNSPETQRLSFEAPLGKVISYMVLIPAIADGFKYTDGLIFDNFKWGENNRNTSSINSFSSENSIHQSNDIEYISDKIFSENKLTTDTLELSEKYNTADLSIQNNKLDSIGVFDITGSGDNTIKLDINTLLQHGEKNLFIDDGKMQLVVKGNKGDTVQISDIFPEEGELSDWQLIGNSVSIAGAEYQVYTHGSEAELLVQQGVKVEII